MFLEKKYVVFLVCYVLIILFSYGRNIIVHVGAWLGKRKVDDEVRRFVQQKIIRIP